MLDLKPDVTWQQYFPTYNAEHRDILLEEYKTSSDVLATEEKTFSTISKLIIFICTIILPVLIPIFSQNNSNVFTVFISSLITENKWTLIIIGLSLTCTIFYLLLYISNIRKNIVYAARKVVVLRRMLDLSFGRTTLILPHDRLEGADDPFHIKFYNSLWDVSNLPFVFTAIIFSILLTIISERLENILDFNIFVIVIPIFTILYANMSKDKFDQLLVLIALLAVFYDNTTLVFVFYVIYIFLYSLIKLHYENKKTIQFFKDVFISLKNCNKFIKKIFFVLLFMFYDSLSWISLLLCILILIMSYSFFYVFIQVYFPINKKKLLTTAKKISI